MIRLTALWLFVAAICGMAWRDRFIALCGLILLSVISQHPDAPTQMFGISGLNPWNVALLGILVAWFSHRDTSLLPPTPRWMVYAFSAYWALLMVGAVRLLIDLGTLLSRREILAASGHFMSVSEAVKDTIINPCKYLLVGALLFMSCRTRRHAWYGIMVTCVVGLAYSLLMYKSMKGAVFFGDYNDARRLTTKLIGLHANDLAGLLTATFWALISVALVQRGKLRLWALLGAAIVLPTLIGCHSRAAYLANVGVAFMLAVVRWRRLLLLFPAGVLLVVFVFPQVLARLGMDLGTEDSVTEEVDWNAVTAGRTENIWEPVLMDIGASPIIGIGRLGIGRIPHTQTIFQREGYVPTHPHNSYLELVLDSGIVGLAIVLWLLGTIGWNALGMLRTRGDPLIQVTGAVGFCAVINVMALSLSSQFFYPKESLMWLIAAGAMTYRVLTIHQARMSDARMRIATAAPTGRQAYVEVQPS